MPGQSTLAATRPKDGRRSPARAAPRRSAPPGRRRTKWRPVTDPAAFQSTLVPGFAAEIATMVPEAELLRRCIQCGTCSGVCPMAAYMDVTPRRLIEMTREGARDDVVHSVTPWVCTSCYACTEGCPKQIPITEIMHAIRRISLQERTYPRRFSTAVMTRELVDLVGSRGRSTESWISMKLYLKTHPTLVAKNAGVGMHLIRQGRLGLRRDKIRARKELRAMLKAASS